LCAQALLCAIETCRLLKGLTASATQSIWGGWYTEYERHEREPARESARKSTIYNKLKKGPAFQETIKHVIPRKHLVEEIRQLVIPAEEDRLCPVIIGEHGTGKTGLIKLAMNEIDEPKGVVYVDIIERCGGSYITLYTDTSSQW
jgi:hypothetical protein